MWIKVQVDKVQWIKVQRQLTTHVPWVDLGLRVSPKVRQGKARSAFTRS